MVDPDGFISKYFKNNKSNFDSCKTCLKSFINNKLGYLNDYTTSVWYAMVASLHEGYVLPTIYGSVLSTQLNAIKYL